MKTRGGADLDLAIEALIAGVTVALSTNTLSLFGAIVRATNNGAILAPPVATTDTKTIFTAHTITRALVGALTL